MINIVAEISYNDKYRSGKFLMIDTKYRSGKFLMIDTKYRISRLTLNIVFILYFKMSASNHVDVNRQEKDGKIIEITTMNYGFMNWKKHIEICVTKKHHKYNDLMDTSCTLYFQLFNTRIRWGKHSCNYVTRIEK
jgi:hypothetical protein